ncbi:MAG: hydrogenase 1 maturation [Actinobacteria bacterium]|nr:MAG: hydrogenase 1 maturation [Actinomycetota bacterium]
MSGERLVLVIGVGNVLMRDEGIGPRVAAELSERYIFPDDVEVMDAGTMGLGMLHLFRGLEYLLIVDAIDGTGHPAGTVVQISPEDFAPNQVMHSLHDIRLVDVLNAAQLIDAEPKLTDCVGVQIEDIAPESFSIGLTQSVEGAVSRATAAALILLEENGVEATPLPSEDADDRLFLDAVRGACEEMREKRRGDKR